LFQLKSLYDLKKIPYINQYNLVSKTKLNI
jgi:hypothetical protein